MKFKFLLCIFSLCLTGSSVLRAQDFQNLGFEDANLSVIPSGQYGSFVPITNALPFWTGYLGTNQVTQVLQNNLTLGNASIDILGPDYYAPAILQGQYTVVLQAGQNPFTGSGVINASLAQVDRIPTNANSITLEAAGTNFTVSFAGQTILLSPIGRGPNYTLFGGDISSFAGQVGELRLTTLAPLGPDVGLDDIQFSPYVIPEPNTLALVRFALPLALLGWRRKRGLQLRDRGNWEPKSRIRNRVPAGSPQGVMANR
jgi:hypothetical protein